jgi:hypothetical protein
MNDLLQRVRIFLASPGDVTAARDAIRRGVQRVNKLAANRNGFQFEVTGWEDIPAGRGDRAQDLINPYVDQATIFIGVLHRRFGTPNGVAESGTEEEYVRARNRSHRESSPPTVKVFFKRTSDVDAAAPDAQLARVLAFKVSRRRTCSTTTSSTPRKN